MEPGLELTVAHDVQEIDQGTWDHLSAGRPFSSQRWYAFGQAVLADCAPTYLLLSANGEPIARAAFWRKQREWLPITSRLLRLSAEKLLQKRPLFACETPLVSFSGLILGQSPQRAEALELIARQACELARQAHSLCALFGYIDPADLLEAHWPPSFSTISYEDEETVLSIRWQNFDDFLKSLAQSTRRNYKLHKKEADQLGLDIRIESSVTAMDEAIPLIEKVETYHKVGHRPWVRAMLQHADLVNFHWITARMDNRLVGCCALFADGSVQTATLLGLDYSFPKWIYVYYQLIYTLVRCAIESGCAELYGGGGAYELKRRLHFHKLPDDCMLISPTGSLTGWALRYASRWMGNGGSRPVDGYAEQI